jgi:hypothetical protein
MAFIILTGWKRPESVQEIRENKLDSGNIPGDCGDFAESCKMQASGLGSEKNDTRAVAAVA